MEKGKIVIYSFRGYPVQLCFHIKKNYLLKQNSAYIIINLRTPILMVDLFGEFLRKFTALFCQNHQDKVEK